MKLSATSLETFARCERKWAWNKIAGIPEPAQKSLILGTKVHKILELYEATGALPDMSTFEGQVAMSGLHLLPSSPQLSPGESLEIEEHFEVEYEGLVFHGQADLIHYRPGMRPKVYDHKTNKNAQYIKTPEQLRSNIQAALYSFVTSDATGCTDVDLQWTYFSTGETRRATPVLVDAYSIEEAKRVLEPHLVNGERMTKLKMLQPDPRDLPYNNLACNDYNGCPYRAKCNLSPVEAGWFQLPGGNDMSIHVAGSPADAFFANLEAQNRAAAPQVPAASPSTGPQAPAPYAPPTQGPPIGVSVSRLANPGTYAQDPSGITVYNCHCGAQQSVDAIARNSGRCMRCNQPAAAAAPQAAPPPVAQAAQTISFTLYEPAPAPVVMPLPLPTAPQAPAAQPPAPGVGHMYAVNPPEGISPAPPERPELAAAAPVALPEGPAKASRGRPKKQPAPEPPAPLPAPGHPLQASAPAEFVQAYSAHPPTTALPETETKICRLYVDCVPNHEYEDLSQTLFPELRQGIAQREAIPHYCMVDYAKGTGLFMAMVEHAIKTGPTRTAVFVDTSTQDGKNALGVLSAHAGVIVRAVK